MRPEKPRVFLGRIGTRIGTVEMDQLLFLASLHLQSTFQRILPPWRNRYLERSHACGNGVLVLGICYGTQMWIQKKKLREMVASLQLLAVD